MVFKPLRVGASTLESPRELLLACLMPHTLSVGYAQFLSFIWDEFGCRAGLATGAALCCVGSALQSGASSLPMFVVARGILGCGTVFLGSSGAPLITEIAHPAHRTTATALFNTPYALGSIVAGWATFGTFRIHGSAAWRIPSALQGLPSVIQLCGLYFVPESPCWLISKDRSEEALAFLAKYYAEGEESDPVSPIQVRPNLGRTRL